MKIENITLAVLKAMGACAEGIEFFKKGHLDNFPISRISEIEGDYRNFIHWLNRRNLDQLEITDTGFVRTYDDGSISTYDCNGNELTHKDSYGYSWERTYDCNGNKLTHKDGYGYSWEKTYDCNGNLLTYKNNNGMSWERTYDSNGNELTHKNSTGFSWEKTYDCNGNQLTYKDSTGYSWESTYDCNGNELTYKDSDGDSWEKTSADYPVLSKEEFKYYPNGQLQSVLIAGKAVLEIPLI